MDEHSDRGLETVAAFAPSAGRYRAHELLGRGGMGCVYRVTDSVSGREVALKQLVLSEHSKQCNEITALFEREFHTLAQLRHPSVIEVYDYGINSAGPYYTMELLDGGDLRERSPMPWRQACSLLFDVCSSLALLHSRRLLHRDVSPRNVRCTRDGTAKLIDFGAMGPMGRGGAHVVGTPPFTPPEAVQRSTLDARSDLFAVGATLYYALTRGLAYPARDFAGLRDAWRFAPVPPSKRVAGIPAALDDLVISLLSLEPALRPRSAFEVMQRLAAIGGFECRESAGVSRGYLSTPLLVGRESALLEVRDQLARSIAGNGGGLLIHGAPGLGRSRMLDACALEAKTLGATVLRAAAIGGTDDDFAVAQALLQHVQEALSSEPQLDRFPELFLPMQGDLAADASDGGPRTQLKLKRLNDPDADPDDVQGALGRLMLTLSRKHALVIVVDDVHLIDAASAAFLASLIDLAEHDRILVALTAERSPSEPTSVALQVLSGRCRRIGLTALTGEQTEVLLGSVFGDVPNLALVAREVATIAHGNPREIIDIAQHLVDNRSIRYAGGSWTLPNHLSAADLPDSAEAAIRARVGVLSPLARFMLEAHALAFYPAFTREDYQALCSGTDSSALDDAISELLSQQALASDGRTYTLANRVWAAALTDLLDAAQTRARHAALCALYQGKSSTALIHHLFAAGQDERGFDAMQQRMMELAQHFDFRAALRMNVPKLAPSYLRALDVARALGRPQRELHELRRWLLSLSVITDARYYWSAAPAWLEQLEHDSGLDLWRADCEAVSPSERLTRALARANERYLATPEAERVYRVDEAIRALAHYVAVSAAVGARTMDSALIARLPELLEPFAPLSPVVHAIWQNVTAAREANCFCRYESARARWIEALGRLDQITGAELQHVEVIRNAATFGLAVCEVVIGLPSAMDWAASLDRDPMHRVNALYLRKIVRLEQGDWDAADRLRRQAEVFALQAGSTQMFTSLLAAELSTHAQARDLAGLKDVMGRIEPLAAQHAGWVPYRHLAEGRFQLIRGDLQAAERELRHCIEMTAPDARDPSRVMPAWIAANTDYVETLLAQGRHAEARTWAGATLTRCEALGIEVQTRDLEGLCALADAQLGDFDAAVARLDAVIDRQNQLRLTGLKLGVLYEMRARVALLAGDTSAFAQYARLTAREFRHSAGSPLGARFERLMNEARRCGHEPPRELLDIEPATLIESSQLGTLPAGESGTGWVPTARQAGPKER